MDKVWKKPLLLQEQGFCMNTLVKDSNMTVSCLMCCLQVVQSDSEEVDGFEGAGQRVQLRRHRC